METMILQAASFLVISLPAATHHDPGMRFLSTVFAQKVLFKPNKRGVTAQLMVSSHGTKRRCGERESREWVYKSCTKSWYKSNTLQEQE